MLLVETWSLEWCCLVVDVDSVNCLLMQDRSSPVEIPVSLTKLTLAFTGYLDLQTRSLAA